MPTHRVTSSPSRLPLGSYFVSIDAVQFHMSQSRELFHGTDWIQPMRNRKRFYRTQSEDCVVPRGCKRLNWSRVTFKRTRKGKNRPAKVFIPPISTSLANMCVQVIMIARVSWTKLRWMGYRENGGTWVFEVEETRNASKFRFLWQDKNERPLLWRWRRAKSRLETETPKP